MGRSVNLSQRENTVLYLLAWGHTNKAIADSLDVGVKTIELHKANGMRKLALVRRADLVRYAVDHGWMQGDALPDDDDETFG